MVEVAVQTIAPQDRLRRMTLIDPFTGAIFRVGVFSLVYAQTDQGWFESTALPPAEAMT